MEKALRRCTVALELLLDVMENGLVSPSVEGTPQGGPSQSRQIKNVFQANLKFVSLRIAFELSDVRLLSIHAPLPAAP